MVEIAIGAKNSTQVFFDLKMNWEMCNQYKS